MAVWVLLLPPVEEEEEEEPTGMTLAGPPAPAPPDLAREGRPGSAAEDE